MLVRGLKKVALALAPTMFLIKDVPVPAHQSLSTSSSAAVEPCSHDQVTLEKTSQHVIASGFDEEDDTVSSSSSDSQARRILAKKQKCRACDGPNSPYSSLRDLYAGVGMPSATSTAATVDERPKSSSSSGSWSRTFGSEPSSTPCPATYKELGNATWLYLHSMAAYYPERPDAALEESMVPFFNTFAQVYPCESCRDHMQEYVRANPPDASSNEALSVWLCRFHNAVNANLGKPASSCDPDYLIQRYRDGPADGSCD